MAFGPALSTPLAECQHDSTIELFAAKFVDGFLDLLRKAVVHDLSKLFAQLGQPGDLGGATQTVTVHGAENLDHSNWFGVRDRRGAGNVIYVRRWTPNAG